MVTSQGTPWLSLFKSTASFGHVLARDADSLQQRIEILAQHTALQRRNSICEIEFGAIERPLDQFCSCPSALRLEGQ